MTDESGLDDGLAAGAAPRKPSKDKPKQDGRSAPRTFTPEERLLILDVWQRSELGAPRFAELVGISDHTIYQWKRQFDKHGPAGLEDRPRGSRKGESRLPEPTQRAILMLKRNHPDWGCDRIHHTLLRSAGYTASPGAIQRVLLQSGYTVEAVATKQHAPPRLVQRFERARPNQLWQTDLFTFLLKRENRRLYMVVFLDDHSRFVVSHWVGSTSTGSMVREALESGIVTYGPPEEVLTDNGPQYHTWRGKSAFSKHLRKRGIRHIVSRPKHPQTLGKVERFWKTLWSECLESAVMRDLDDARARIGHFVDYYNFQRTHQGIGGLVPADRFFGSESEVRQAIEAQVQRNALELACNGIPKRSFYLTGSVDGKGVSLHGEGGKLVLTRGDGRREEVELSQSKAAADAADGSGEVSDDEA